MFLLSDVERTSWDSVLEGPLSIRKRGNCGEAFVCNRTLCRPRPFGKEIRLAYGRCSTETARPSSAQESHENTYLGGGPADGLTPRRAYIFRKGKILKEWSTNTLSDEPAFGGNSACTHMCTRLGDALDLREGFLKGGRRRRGALAADVLFARRQKKNGNKRRKKGGDGQRPGRDRLLDLTYLGGGGEFGKRRELTHMWNYRTRRVPSDLENKKPWKESC